MGRLAAGAGALAAAAGARSAAPAPTAPAAERVCSRQGSESAPLRACAQDVPPGQFRTAAQEAALNATATAYTPPQFGRRRAPDIMYTGPSMRDRPTCRGGGGGLRLVGGGGGGRPASPTATSTTITNVWGPR